LPTFAGFFDVAICHVAILLKFSRALYFSISFVIWEIPLSQGLRGTKWPLFKVQGFKGSRWLGVVER
ncbi:MAG: hypothetical protein ACXW6J_14630, partial [Candidatus Binatia bacterium]